VFPATVWLVLKDYWHLTPSAAFILAVLLGLSIRDMFMRASRGHD
jgi:hypothetical protein